jgi:hypothetical protein
MKPRSSWIRATCLGALVLGMLAVDAADAWAWHGGGGRGARAPRVSAYRGSYNAPRMPRAAGPARTNGAMSRTHTNNSHSLAANALNSSSSKQIHANGKSALATTGTVNPGTTGRGNSRATNTAAPGTLNSSTGAIAGASGTSPTGFNPNTYTYGQGSGARSYRPYGYGSGYRNRYYGGRYGYGRSQGNNRAIIGRLRAVEMNLARIDHDYQGHRVRAMHAVAMAIRQLSHRSMIYNGVGFSSGMNNGRGMGMGGGGLGAGAGGRGRGRLPQAQSDARMSHSLRTLQGINMQLGSQASFTTGHARARGHVTRAIQELNVALSIR